MSYFITQAYNAKKEGRYSSAKLQGYLAVVFSVLNMAYTGFITVFLIGLVFGLHCGSTNYGC